MKRLKKLLPVLVGLLCCGTLAAQEDRIEILNRLAEQDNPAAYYELSRLAKNNRLPGGPAKNQEAYQFNLFRSADLGYPRARLEGARYLLTRDDSLQGKQVAVPWLSELVKLPLSRDLSPRDLCEAYYLLGYCLATAQGAVPNVVLAQKYFLLSSMMNGDARFRLASDLIRARDPKKPCPDFALLLLYENYLDDPRFVKRLEGFLDQNKLVDAFASFLDRKSQAGDVIATILLADHLMEGGLFPQQRKNALTYYDRAAKLGNTKAALILAGLYRDGAFHLQKDVAKAMEYYEIALGKARTRKEAAAALAVFAAEKKDTDRQFYYLMLADDYAAARKLIESDVSRIQFGPKDLYLKAKEFNAAARYPRKGPQREQYLNRLRMAANAGYPLAVLDDAKVRRPAPAALPGVIRALLAYPRESDPEWHLQLSQYYRTGGNANALFSPEKAREHLLKAAALGSVPALDQLIRAYLTGNVMLAITMDPVQADKYRKMLLEKDITLSKPAYFKQYLDDLPSRADKSEQSLMPLFRSLGLSPYADYAYAKMLMAGDPAFKIERNVANGFLLLHVSAREGNFQRALQDIIGIYNTEVKDAPKDAVQYDPEMAVLYRVFLPRR